VAVGKNGFRVALGAGAAVVVRALLVAVPIGALAGGAVPLAASVTTIDPEADGVAGLGVRLGPLSVAAGVTRPQPAAASASNASNASTISHRRALPAMSGL
jgi:hypothetical protein